MRVPVTGGAGFIGSHLCERLVARTFAGVNRARSLPGYEPGVPIEEGIRRFVEWLRREGAVPA